MSYSIYTKEKALSLRKKGYSIREIAKILKIAQGTSSLWCEGIILNENAQQRLKKRKILGQYNAIQTTKKKGEIAEKLRIQHVTAYLSQLKITDGLAKLCCALLFWCEGNKSKTIVRFTNSDPTLIKLFLSLFRQGFSLDEKKFRGLVHIHEYHNDSTQKEFWSKITNIPLEQFHHSYKKPNTGKRIHKNYPGCIAVTYYDANLAKELATIYNLFTHRGIVQW